MNATSLPASSRLLFDELLARPNLRLRVGDHVVDVGALRVITRPEHPRLTGKSVAVLIELVRRSGETVTREQLFDRVWADRVITPDVLTQAIKELRRAFGDDAKPSRYIETIPRVGYRLIAPTSVVEPEESAPLPEEAVLRADNDPEHGPIETRALGAARRPARWIALALVIATIVIAAGAFAFRRATLKAPTWRAQDLRALTADPSYERRPSISPDGTRVIYSQHDPASKVDRLMMRSIDQPQAVHLTAKVEGFEEMSAWSPDGLQIAFERLDSNRCTVYVASIIGGTEHEVGQCHDYLANYFDFTPDGKALITAEGPGGASGSMRLVRWDIATGVKTPLDYERSADYQDLEAHYSPDGKWIAFRRGLAPYSDLCVMPAAGGAVRQLTHLDARIRGYAWTPDGRGLVFASNHQGSFALYTVAIDGSGVQPLGVGPAEYPMAARTSNVFVYEIPKLANRLSQIALGAAELVPELLAKSTGSDATPVYSPRGDRIAFVSDRTGAPQIWLYDFATSAASAWTDFHDALLLAPSWNADGNRLLFTLRAAGAARLVELDLATRRQHSITGPGDDVLSGRYGPDADSFLVVLNSTRKHNQLVFIEHAGSAAEMRSVLAEGVEHFDLDPALRRVYYTQHSKVGLFARDLAGGGERELTPLVQASQLDGWRVVDGKIWYAGQLAWHPTQFIEFDPQTSQSRIVASVDVELREAGFSVAPDHDRLVFAPIGNEDTDVGAFRLQAAD